MSSISDEKTLHQQIKNLSDAFLLSSRALNYKSVLQTATRHFKVFTDADATVLMLNDNSGNLTPVRSIGIPFAKIKDTSIPSSTRLKDIIAHPIFDVRYPSFMNTPLILNRKLIGLYAVFSTIPEKFHRFEHNNYEGHCLTMLASYIAVSIGNSIMINSIDTMEHSQLDWEKAFDEIEDLISINDADFNIVRANKAVAKKFNTSQLEIVGKKCYTVFHGTEESWETCPHRKSMDTMTTCTEQIEDPHMCGIFHITAFPHFNKSGKRIGSIIVARDITKHCNVDNQLRQQ